MSVLVSLLAFTLAAGSAPEVTLTAQKPVSRTIDAYPRVAAPDTPETAKLNAALAKSDDRVKNAARDCGQNDPEKGQWSRAVTAPLRYGDFVTLTSADEWFCSAYSGSFLTAQTYDLTTGEPVDWRTLILPRVAGDPAIATSGDASRVSVVVSPILNEVYRREVLFAMDAEQRGACADSFEANYTLMLWLDAEHEGLSMRGVNMPKRTFSCGPTVTLSLDDLAKIKAEPRMIELLKAAHAAHAWTDDLRPTGARPRPAR